MGYIRIYASDTAEDGFASNGIAVLNEAKNVVEKLEINGDRTLTFELPECGKLKYAQDENIAVLDGRRYRIKSANNGQITASAIYNDAAYKHIQSLPDMINRKPIDIMTAIFDGTPVHIMTAGEVSSIGLEWVDDATDFFACAKLTPIGALQTLMETLDKYKIHNELYVDNYNLALVRQIGKDRGARLNLAYNAKSISPTRDTTELVTRLYPYGKDDLHIGSVNGGKQYIDSPNYATWKREGYMEFTEIDDPALLMEAAQAQFSASNPDRVDVPKYSVTVDYAERIQGEISLGDIVTVADTKYGIVSKQRVKAVELHPFERGKNTLTLGKPPKSIGDLVNGIVDSTARYTNSTTDRGEVKTGWLEMMQKNESVSINSALQDEDIALYKTGSLYESQDGNAAVAIIKGRIALANSRDADGAWNWTTVMDGGKVIVNQVFTGALYTDLVRVLSKDGTLKIEDNLITMYDENETLRFEAGYDPDYGLHGQYIFALYNDGGEKTAYLDSGGNLTIRGIFKTGEANEARTVIDGNGIQSYNANNQKHGIWSNPSGNDLADLSLWYHGGEFFRVYNGINGPSLMCYGNTVLSMSASGATAKGKWGFEKGASGSFATSDGKMITVEKGIITKIV